MKLSAEKMRKISLANSDGEQLKALLADIEKTAKTGRCLYVCNALDMSYYTKKQLLSLGFKLDFAESYFDYIISW